MLQPGSILSDLLHAQSVVTLSSGACLLVHESLNRPHESYALSEESSLSPVLMLSSCADFPCLET